MNSSPPGYLSSERCVSDKKYYHLLHLALTDSLEKTGLDNFDAERREI